MLANGNSLMDLFCKNYPYLYTNHMDVVSYCVGDGGDGGYGWGDGGGSGYGDGGGTGYGHGDGSGYGDGVPYGAGYGHGE